MMTRVEHIGLIIKVNLKVQCWSLVYVIIVMRTYLLTLSGKRGGFFCSHYQLYRNKTFLNRFSQLSAQINLFLHVLAKFRKFFYRESWDMVFLWKRGIIFQELVIHTKNYLFAFCWNIATYVFTTSLLTSWHFKTSRYAKKVFTI